MANERQLSSVLSEFARTMVTDFPIQAILDHLVERIVDVMPITAAGVTLISPGQEPRYVAASDESALRFEQLQTELGEGPVPAGPRERRAQSPCRTSDTTLGSRGSVPARSRPGSSGCSPSPCDTARVAGRARSVPTTPGALGIRSMDAAQTLADVAAAYLLNAQARADLQRVVGEVRTRLALHDPLTGLPNRVLLLERLDHAVQRARRTGSLAAVLFVDLDDFKSVNDHHGHSVGDALLVMVAEPPALDGSPRRHPRRMSGDEFVVLCEDLDGHEEAHTIARRVGESLEAAFEIDGIAATVTASVGLHSRPGIELSVDLLRDADAAMYRAKRSGGGQHEVLDLRTAADDAPLERRDLGRAIGDEKEQRRSAAPSGRAASTAADLPRRRRA